MDRVNCSNVDCISDSQLDSDRSNDVETGGKVNKAFVEDELGDAACISVEISDSQRDCTENDGAEYNNSDHKNIDVSKFSKDVTSVKGDKESTELKDVISDGTYTEAEEDKNECTNSRFSSVDDGNFKTDKTGKGENLTNNDKTANRIENNKANHSTATDDGSSLSPEENDNNHIDIGCRSDRTVSEGTNGIDAYKKDNSSVQHSNGSCQPAVCLQNAKASSKVPVSVKESDRKASVVSVTEEG